MRHRIFVDEIAAHVTIRDDEFHHTIRVVRARVGEEVELFDRAGKLAAGTIETIDRDHAIIRVERTLPSREATHALNLAMAIIQLEKFELVLQKATELGVHTIIPLVTDRIELRPERYNGKMERWQKIVFEAVKQSGRSVVPVIEPPTPFDTAITREGIRVVFDADQPPPATGQPGNPATGHPPPATPQPRNPATLFIGPEGGWSERELDLARTHGAIFQRLGPRRLRAETAAIAALAVLAARTGDL